MEKDDRYTRITLRIPRDLHEKLAAAADVTSKSMNAEIIGRLEFSFDEDARLQQMAEYHEQSRSEGNSDPSIAMALARLRMFLSSAEEAAKQAERLYDEETGEHAFTIDEEGKVIKSYER